MDVVNSRETITLSLPMLNFLCPNIGIAMGVKSFGYKDGEDQTKGEAQTELMVKEKTKYIKNHHFLKLAIVPHLFIKCWPTLGVFILSCGDYVI